MPTATITQSIQHGWLKLESDSRQFDADCGLDAPGPWKPVGHGNEAHWAFEVPLETLLGRVESLEPDEDPQGQVVSMVTSWAQQTIDGGVPRGWAPPPRERLDELVPAAALSFRSGSFIEPALLVADAGTLRVQVSLGKFDEAIPASRREWVAQLLAAISGLRLIRAGLRVRLGHGGSIEAAIDLTGAPTPIAEALLPVAVDALRHCFALYVPTATLIGDAACPSRMLDASPSCNTSLTRSLDS
jgi:hypothetical protein